MLGRAGPRAEGVAQAQDEPCVGPARARLISCRAKKIGLRAGPRASGRMANYRLIGVAMTTSVDDDFIAALEDLLSILFGVR